MRPLPWLGEIQCRRIIFFFNDTATTEIYTLSLHDALPISRCLGHAADRPAASRPSRRGAEQLGAAPGPVRQLLLRRGLARADQRIRRYDQGRREHLRYGRGLDRGRAPSREENLLHPLSAPPT